jgi:Protein of unknown function (DUF4058)
MALVFRRTRREEAAMPIYDWTRVEAGIFHDFHHGWIEEIKRALNGGRLPDDYYALAEQFAGGFGRDVLTLQDISASDGDEPDGAEAASSGRTALLTAPTLNLTGETDMAYYRRKQSSVVIRHISGDRVVAVIEVVSPVNKASRNPLRALVDKAAHLLEKGIHLLIIDLLPPTQRDPQGIHRKVWRAIAGKSYIAPGEKRLTLAAYESGVSIRAYVVHPVVGDALSDMPVFLEPCSAASNLRRCVRRVSTAMAARARSNIVEHSRRRRNINSS